MRGLLQPSDEAFGYCHHIAHGRARALRLLRWDSFQPARDLIEINRVIALCLYICADDFFSAATHQIELVRSGSGGSLMPSPPAGCLPIRDNSCYCS